MLRLSVFQRLVCHAYRCSVPQVRCRVVEVTLSLCSQGLSNAAWWHVYANACRVQEVLTDEQQMHQLDLAAFFRHMCQRCRMTCTIFRDEGSAFTVLASLRLETPVMARIRIGLLQLLPQADQEALAERYVCVIRHTETAASSCSLVPVVNSLQGLFIYSAGCFNNVCQCSVKDLSY